MIVKQKRIVAVTCSISHTVCHYIAGNSSLLSENEETCR